MKFKSAKVPHKVNRVDRVRSKATLGVAAATMLTLATVASETFDSLCVRAAAAAASAASRPTVGIDEAHGNAGATSGFFKPLSDLLGRAGYGVVPVAGRFETERLTAIDLLVVSTGDRAAASAAKSQSAAIDDRECDLVRDWVRGGGSLLVVAGGTPFVGETDPLAARFGVQTGGGRVFDRVPGGGMTTALEFSRANGRLGEHPILRGSGRGRIARVLGGGGESLSVPRGAAILLKLSGTAREAMTRDDLEAEEFAARQEAGIAGSFSVPVAGRGQAIALSLGKGRLVVLGDAYLLSGLGLSVSEADNRQFALNVVGWLSRRLA
jgi:hypothetical protein